MTTTEIEIPGEDAWVLARLGAMLAHRLIHGSDDSSARQSLLRLLFGIQRLPILIPDLSISIGNGHIYVEINSELFGLVSFTEGGHTEFRQQYFKGSSHCLHWCDFLTGDAKRNAIEERLKALEDTLAHKLPLSIEDHSVEGYADELRLDDYMEYSLSYEKT